MVVKIVVLGGGERRGPFDHRPNLDHSSGK